LLIFKFKSSLKTSAIAFHAVVFGVHEAPCSTGRSSKGQLAVVEQNKVEDTPIHGGVSKIAATVVGGT
jgi:hypothetical protein